MVQICVKTDFKESKMCKYAAIFNCYMWFAVLTRCLFLPRNLTAASLCSYHRIIISPPDGHSIVKVRLRVYEPLTSLRGIYVPKSSLGLQFFTNCFHLSSKTPSIGRQRESEIVNLQKRFFPNISQYPPLLIGKFNLFFHTLHSNLYNLFSFIF